MKKGTKIGAVAHALKRNELIFSEYLFLFCSLVVYKGRIVAGEYELSPDMSTFRIAKKMAHGERKVYTLKIVEGYNLYTIGETIEKAGIMDGKTFLQLAHTPEFLKSLGIPSDSLEGYLAPDTYFFSKETGVDEFLEKIVRRTFKFFEKEDIEKRMQELHMDMFQVLSFASIIEKEAQAGEGKAHYFCRFPQQAAPRHDPRRRPDRDLRPGKLQQGLEKGRPFRRDAVQHLPGERTAEGTHMQSFEELDHGCPLPGPKRYALFRFEK